MVTITIQGVAPLRRKVAQIRSRIWMQNLIQDAASSGLVILKRNTPSDTGRTAGAWTPVLSVGMARLTNPLPSSGVMDTGRRPGATPPPISALEAWGNRHGFNTRSSLFALAKAIGRRGIRGRRYVERSLQELRAAMPEVARKTIALLERRI